MNGWTIDVDDPRVDDVQALLERHLQFASQHSPPEHVHALDVSGLLGPEITFVSCRRSGVVLGVGAIKLLGGGHAELKSMHTAAEARGVGVGEAIVSHLLDVARTAGCTRVSLETGSMAAFAAARRLYARLGFVDCAAIEGYLPSDYSCFMTRSLI